PRRPAGKTLRDAAARGPRFCHWLLSTPPSSFANGQKQWRIEPDSVLRVESIESAAPRQATHPLPPPPQSLSTAQNGPDFDSDCRRCSSRHDLETEEKLDASREDRRWASRW